MDKKKGRHFEVLISFAVGCLLIVLVSVWQMSFQGESAAGKVLSWSNGCLAAAVVWGGIGLLSLVAKFDGFSALQYFGYVFRKKWTKSGGTGETRHMDSYYDYMKEKKRKESGMAGNRFVKCLLIPAGGYLAAAGILTVVFYFLEK
ncbi:MAG: hypothetical protein Q4F41_02430 [Eubacteriales bacterium]|nr:hypothetical protein [Eubacteriales bacterium]